MKTKEEIVAAITTLQEVLKAQAPCEGYTLHLTAEEVSLDDDEGCVLLDEGTAEQCAEHMT